MANKKNPLVFMDISIDGDPTEKLVIQVPNNLCYDKFAFVFFYLVPIFFLFVAYLMERFDLSKISLLI